MSSGSAPFRSDGSWMEPWKREAALKGWMFGREMWKHWTQRLIHAAARYLGKQIHFYVFWPFIQRRLFIKTATRVEIWPNCVLWMRKQIVWILCITTNIAAIYLCFDRIPINIVLYFDNFVLFEISIHTNEPPWFLAGSYACFEVIWFSNRFIIQSNLTEIQKRSNFL